MDPILPVTDKNKDQPVGEQKLGVALIKRKGVNTGATCCVIKFF
jgi:hypothetical protein